MPIETYGAGRTELIRSREQERAREEGRFRRERAQAQQAFESEAEEEGILSFNTGTIGAILGFSTGGLPGAAEGYSYGTEVGKWGHKAISDFDPEDYYVSTDVGKFDVNQRYDLQDFNRVLSSTYTSDYWQDVTDTGANLLSLWYADSGKEKKDINSPKVYDPIDIPDEQYPGYHYFNKKERDVFEV